MSRIHNLTAALAILALGVTTSGCARGNANLSFGEPRTQHAANVSEEVAETAWEECDGECRFEEARRMCSTTVMVVGAQRQQAHAAFMRFGDRQSFRVAVMKHCAGGVRYAENRYSTGQRRDTPHCDKPGEKFDTNYSMCVGNQLHIIPLSDERKEYYKDCPEIETQLVRRGNRLVKQQRCKAQETRARSSDD